MLCVCVVIALLAATSATSLFDFTSGCSTPLDSFLSFVGLNPRCGLLPSCPRNRDCRLLPAIVLGYCCGCAHPLDRLPVLCPPNLPCPLPRPKLCTDYNFLLDCCCF